MVYSLNLRELVWLIVSLVEVSFLAFLLVQRLYRSHAFFSLYILSLVLQTIVVAVAYRHWGATSKEYWMAAWFSQAVVVGTRWLAVAEIARKIFARYSGIWRLAGTVLLLMSIGILSYSVAVSGIRFDLMVLSADRRVELCIALFIVAMFVFARYYRLPIADTERQLAIGFCLYSCVWVINETLYQAWRRSLGEVWDFILTIAFLASVIIWFNALRVAAPSPASAPDPTVSPDVYAQLSEEVNSRLLTLNNRLSHLLRSEDSRS